MTKRWIGWVNHSYLSAALIGLVIGGSLGGGWMVPAADGPSETALTGEQQGFLRRQRGQP